MLVGVHPVKSQETSAGRKMILRIGNRTKVSSQVF